MEEKTLNGTETFYDNLAPISDFSDIFDPLYYRKAPEDWFIVIIDIVNSTTAISNGKYKEVNTAGAMGAMAISNLKHDMSFPFLFGGDGMVYLIPPQLIKDVTDVLVDTRNLVENLFQLEQRVGLLRVSDIYAAGYSLDVAKFAVSHQYTQAIISGSGIDYAEKLIKRSDEYLQPKDYRITRRANYDGFTCRWKDIPSSKGETISFILKTLNSDEVLNQKLLTEVLSQMRIILGDESDYHPLSEENLTLAENSKQVLIEAKVQSRSINSFITAVRTAFIRVEIFFHRLIMKYRIGVGYKKKKPMNAVFDNIISSDFRKFDGTLKMVVACTTDDRKKLEEYLESLYNDKRIYYGIHVSDRALMTCLIHLGSGSEVHFVDTADGGYAMAARKLKEQMKV
jgi:hypothetical protein